MCIINESIRMKTGHTAGESMPGKFVQLNKN